MTLAKKPAAEPKPYLPYWPYCEQCHQPFEFDPMEPFAYCGCPGASEWGNPRPADWIPNPHLNVPISVPGIRRT